MPWDNSGLPQEYLTSEIHKIALCDFVTRKATASIRGNSLDRNLSKGKGGWSGPKGGAFNINSCGQEILPRTSALISALGDTIELRFLVSLPAAGRSIMGEEAFQILGVNTIGLVRDSMVYDNLDVSELRSHIECALTQHHLRHQAEDHGLVAFIANGAILPRASGASQLPMSSGSAIPMKSPKELEVTLSLPNGNSVVGLGIPRGITLLTGGGFHGKSTLLNAIEHGVYNQIPTDGRELVVTDPSAMKVRAEDGRSITKVDISPFISNLPGAANTTAFTTGDASGSTSMAANIQEALEAGCRTLLIDEDSSATNLLVRDQRMQGLIRHEPITPLISKARALFAQHGVSTVIVIGGLGDWLSIADNIIVMEHYVPRSIKAEAEAVIAKFPSVIPQSERYGSIPKRSLRIDLAGWREPFAPRKSFITMNRQVRDVVDDPALAEAGIDLSGLDQLVEIGQARTVGAVDPACCSTVHGREERADVRGDCCVSLDTACRRCEPMSVHRLRWGLACSCETDGVSCRGVQDKRHGVES
ncbi:hypothetical protein MRB53_041312 [Persea americana]|nr:hypothetical protein MRB53_041312 [Persea americana]